MAMQENAKNKTGKVSPRETKTEGRIVTHSEWTISACEVSLVKEVVGFVLKVLNVNSRKCPQASVFLAGLEFPKPQSILGQ